MNCFLKYGFKDRLCSQQRVEMIGMNVSTDKIDVLGLDALLY